MFANQSRNSTQNKGIVPLIGVLNLGVSAGLDTITARGRCLIKLKGSTERVDTDEISVVIPFNNDAVSIRFGSRYGKSLPGGICYNSFELIVDISNINDFDIQNKIIPVYKGGEGGRFLYDALDLKKGRNKNSQIIIRNGLAMYFRQSMYNTLNFTVREANQYDTEEGQKRLKEAKNRAAKNKNNNIILMYEKNCSRYEESASVLYEKLIDAGYDNVYYVVDTSIDAVRKLDEKYKKNLIEKDSDKHLECFFACNKFISSETIDHALRIRVANKAAQDKINGRGLSYVFLQHGVMYMVSLNSRLRSGFRQKKTYKLHRTVVSSKVEANHFIELAGMSEKDLYISGLAKFDNSYKYDDADKIIIMPTWRRWETNQAKSDVTKTGYYKMLERMYYAVPEGLRDKVIILPHPLIAEKFKNEHILGERILMASSYDEVLRDCDLLVTDYSSIAYDAYYRGANVVFDWSELDECMEHYGEDAHLMLNENNVFGRVARNPKELANAIKLSYKEVQRDEDIENYRRIVEFHDGRNSERIIEMLIKDGMIEGRH